MTHSTEQPVAAFVAVVMTGRPCLAQDEVHGDRIFVLGGMARSSETRWIDNKVLALSPNGATPQPAMWVRSAP